MKPTTIPIKQGLLFQAKKSGIGRGPKAVTLTSHVFEVLVEGSNPMTDQCMVNIYLPPH